MHFFRFQLSFFPCHPRRLFVFLFVLLDRIPQEVHRLEDADAFARVVHPALFHELDQLPLAEASFPVPRVNVGNPPVDELLLDDSVIVGVVKVPQSRQHPVEVVPEREDVDLLIEIPHGELLRRPVVREGLPVVELAVAPRQVVPLHDRRPVKVPQFEVSVGGAEPLARLDVVVHDDPVGEAVQVRQAFGHLQSETQLLGRGEIVVRPHPSGVAVLHRLLGVVPLPRDDHLLKLYGDHLRHGGEDAVHVYVHYGGELVNLSIMMASFWTSSKCSSV
mmetsp:Transcript_21509/g.45989  ORF Transcript_21509/g.45989 Transcript_21509/m.45989 type:complete len:276 (+) Transcript_21509:267-1094(+)